jgi:hypothetical protein
MRGVRAVARSLGVSRMTAWRWHRAGVLPSVMVGGRVTLAPAAVGPYLVALARAQHAAAAPAPAVDVARAVRAVLRRVTVGGQSVSEHSLTRPSVRGDPANENHSHLRAAGRVGGVMSGGRASGARPSRGIKKQAKAVSEDILSGDME